MSGPQPYSPGSTGTLADVLETGPELQPFTPAGPDGFKAAPSFGDLFRAHLTQQVQATPLYDDAKIGQGYQPIVDALGLPDSENPGYFGDLDATGQARFGNAGSPSRLATEAQQGEQVPFSSNRLADRSLQEALIVDRIRQQRATHPDFLSGVPDTIDGLHDYFEQQQAAKRAAAGATIARGSGLANFGAGMAAGFAEGARTDPGFLPTLVFGGGTASSALQAFGRDALINGVLTAGQLPQQEHNLEENGQHLTLGDAAEQVVGGAVIGGVFGSSVHLFGEHVPPALFKAMPESVQTRWASRMKVGDVRLGDVLGDMDNRELAGFARSTIGDHMTAEEAAAATTLERNQEIGEASPFMPGPAGDAAHNASLADALKGVIDGADQRGPLLSSTALGGTVAAPALGRLDTSATAVPRDIVDFFKAKGLDEAHAYGIAAGIVAESGGDHMALNRTSGAMGLGQWLGSRKAALLERYGPSPTQSEQLEFLWGELTGGDPGGKFVLGAKDAGEVLDAYVRKFMRPAAGAETLGDLERGSKALGGGEIEGGGPVEASAGGDDDLAALQRQADQAEQEAIDLSADDVASEASPRAIDPDLPVLKRDLFASDRDWAEAQLAFYRDQGLVPNGPEEAAGRPLSAETGASGATQPISETAPGAPEDTRGLGIQYHGARGEVPELTEGYYNPNNIYGGFDTFYTTDALDIARGYGRKRSSARVYQAAEREPVRVFDMEKPISVADVESLFGVKPDDDGLVPMAIDQAAIDGKAKLRDVMDEIRGESANEGYAKDDVQELFDTAIHNLREQGFGGMTHIGGLKTGREPHTVKIYFDAANQLDLKDLGGTGPASRAALDAQVRTDEPALKAFEAAGGAKDQLVSLEHDARMAIADPAIASRKYQIDDRQLTFGEILEQIDRDRAAAAALRSCAQ